MKTTNLVAWHLYSNRHDRPDCQLDLLNCPSIGPTSGFLKSSQCSGSEQIVERPRGPVNLNTHCIYWHCSGVSMFVNNTIKLVWQLSELRVQEVHGSVIHVFSFSLHIDMIDIGITYIVNPVVIISAVQIHHSLTRITCFLQNECILTANSDPWLLKVSEQFWPE